MSTSRERAVRYIRRLLEQRDVRELEQCLVPDAEEIAPHAPRSSLITRETVDKRWELLKADAAVRQRLCPEALEGEMGQYACNIENFIGTVQVPIGVAGPLRVRGLFAHGDYYVPLATTEAALVASFTRGAQTVSNAGGVRCAVINEGVGRAPAFAFASLAEAGRFVVWAAEQAEALKAQAEATTKHGKLEDIRFTIEGNHVYVLLEYLTGDAAGQNMVTIATEAVCRYIEANSPVKPRAWYVEGNMSGDKKATAQSFQTVRGKKVVAEAVLPAEIVKRRLHCTPEQMAEYVQVSGLGGVMSGIIGVQGQYANGLAAVYIACGQDAACVAESAVGITRFEVNADGSLYTSVTLPNLIVGTVGGGTGLPSQRACLELMGMAGAGKANAFAEVCAGLVLAGEISIIAALASGQFARAHAQLARERKQA